MRHIGPMDTDFYPNHCDNDDKRFLARAYVLFQKFERVYTPPEALKRGTAFEDLDKPECRAKL